MKEAQADIVEFMTKAGQDVPVMPSIPSREVCALRVRTLAEEVLELAEALDCDLRIVRSKTKGERILGVDANPSSYANDTEPPKTDLREAYDAVLDIMVFAVGTAIALGLDLDPGWKEVHRSNLTKFIDGYRRGDGKWMKGPSFEPPNLQPLIDAMIAAAKRKLAELAKAGNTEQTPEDTA